MITEEQFAAIKRLIVSENCMIDRFEHYVSEIKEPQLKDCLLYTSPSPRDS